MALIQLALDTLSLDDAIALALSVAPYVDVIEAGTPLIKCEGMHAVAGLRAALPHKLLVADMKTMDAGALEAHMAFDAGADLVTVLACASNATIEAALAVAQARGKRIVVDLLGVDDKVARVRTLAALGVHMVGVHTGTDDQARGANPLRDLKEVRRAVSTPLAVAGGISIATLTPILALKPEVVIVGSSITTSVDPCAAARALRNSVDASYGCCRVA